jgi:hypothetical protein
MARKPKPEPDLFGPAPLSEANQNLGLPPNDDEWEAIDAVLDEMHRKAAEARKSDFPASENQ